MKLDKTKKAIRKNVLYTLLIAGAELRISLYKPQFLSRHHLHYLILDCPCKLITHKLKNTKKSRLQGNEINK